jgi:GDPmannose 4,6-dehydratase
MYTVRQFIELCFGFCGIQLRWEGSGINEKGFRADTNEIYVEVDSKYFRPSEVDELCGNPTKAKELLGWNPNETSLEMLVDIMMQHDMSHC